MKNKNYSHQVSYYYEGIDNLSENYFLSMVSNLGKLTGSNRYISQYLCKTNRQVSNIIRKLKENGYINVSMVANQYRTITLTDKCVKIVLPKLEKTKDKVEKTSNPIEETSTPIEIISNPPMKLFHTPIEKTSTNIIDDVKEYDIDDVKAELIADLKGTEEIFMEPIKEDKLDLHDLKNRISEPNNYIEELLSKKLSSTID